MNDVTSGLRVPGAISRARMNTNHPIYPALRCFLGRTLTPDVCAAIATFVVDRAVRPVNVDQFRMARHGDYVVQAEPFEAVLPELHPLHELHWQETEGHRHGLEMNPDYDGMAFKAAMGELVQFTLRFGPEAVLVGQLRMYLGQSMHTQTLLAREDTLFIHPDHRGGMLGMHLLRYAEAALRQIGVREIHADSKLLNKADVLMRRMKYRPVATQFVKVFEEAGDAHA